MARIAVDGNYIFDNDIDSLCDALAGNGVISGLATTQKGAGADMSVDVVLGVYVANGTSVTKSGTTNVVITAAHATLPRKDIIIADSAGNITAVAGTEYAASPVGSTGPQTSAPVPPDITANKIILAEVWVPAAASTIINSYITDKRIVLPNVNLIDDTAGGTNALTTKAASSNIVYDHVAAITGIHGKTILRKTADETVNNSTTMQDDNHLVLPVLANEIWHFKLLLITQQADAGADWKIGFTYPSGTTMFWGTISWEWVVAKALNIESTVVTVAHALTTITGLSYEGIIIVSSTAGSITLQWAQSAAVAANNTIKANSCMICTRLA